ncbi:MAG: hypothetical protein LUQ67_03445 [Methanomicrobiales archaeon]|nr:hypothetical protein [Methanomicrobiales archaeon]
MPSGREPLTLVTVRPADVASLPPIPEEAGVRFTGIAYDVGPDGATFNPPATLSLTVPDSQWDGNTRYLIRTYETGSGSWEEIPTEVDPSSRVVSGPVSHLCLFGLFAGEVLPPTPAPTARLPAADLQAQPGPVMRTPMGIFTGMVSWVYAAALANLPVALTFILVSLGAIYASTRRWWLTRYRTWVTLYLISLTGLLWALFLSTSGGPFWESAWIVITVAGLNLIVHVLRFDRIDLSRRRYVEIGYR